jgi:inorganic pyrophosphatase
MDLRKVKLGKNPPEDFNVVIEIPMNGEPVKYELSKNSSALVVDRFMNTPMRYPHNYGFIPHTLSEDGDPVDVMVVSRVPLAVGSVVRCVAIGVMLMEDEHGKDEKIIAIPHPDLRPFYTNVNEYTDLPKSELDIIEQFFAHYKDLEDGKWVKIEGWRDSKEAKKLILEGIERVNQK